MGGLGTKELAKWIWFTRSSDIGMEWCLNSWGSTAESHVEVFECGSSMSTEAEERSEVVCLDPCVEKYKTSSVIVSGLTGL